MIIFFDVFIVFVLLGLIVTFFLAPEGLEKGSYRTMRYAVDVPNAVVCADAPDKFKIFKVIYPAVDDARAPTIVAPGVDVAKVANTRSPARAPVTAQSANPVDVAAIVPPTKLHVPFLMKVNAVADEVVPTLRLPGGVILRAELVLLVPPRSSSLLLFCFETKTVVAITTVTIRVTSRAYNPTLPRFFGVNIVLY